jgi:hypothetical protein
VLLVSDSEALAVADGDIAADVVELAVGDVEVEAGGDSEAVWIRVAEGEPVTDIVLESLAVGESDVVGVIEADSESGILLSSLVRCRPLGGELASDFVS